MSRYKVNIKSEFNLPTNLQSIKAVFAVDDSLHKSVAFILK